MLALYPMWPIYLAAGVLLTALFAWCVLVAGSRFDEAVRRPGRSLHYQTGRLGVFWCAGCGGGCDDGAPCFCCREVER